MRIVFLRSTKQHESNKTKQNIMPSSHLFREMLMYSTERPCVLIHGHQDSHLGSRDT